LDAKLLLLQTEVDAARTESDRVALYRACVNTLKEYEQLADARKQAALGSEATKLRVKARRLEVEIRLQQATVKTADRGRPKVVTTSVTTKDINIAQQYACTIAARRHIEVRSLQNGYLEEVPLKEGQSVKQGDVLFKVAPALYLAKLDAELAEAKLAELELSDAEKLLNGKVISKVEIERSQAKRDGAQARAKLAQAELNFTVVRAPFDGLVEFEDPESQERLQVNADGFKAEYVNEITQFRERYKRECFQSGIDYVPLDTSMRFDRALTEYLISRRSRC